jgi:hypothetical protein
MYLDGEYIIRSSRHGVWGIEFVGLFGATLHLVLGMI